MRELTVREIHDLRPCAEVPIAKASFEGVCAAISAGFCEGGDTWEDRVGFQCACICAMQGGKLDGEDFPVLWSKAPIVNGTGAYEGAFRRFSSAQPYQDQFAEAVTYVAARFIIRGHQKIDIRRLYADLCSWYDDDKKTFFRWLHLIGQYEMRISDAIRAGNSSDDSEATEDEN